MITTLLKITKQNEKKNFHQNENTVGNGNYDIRLLLNPRLQKISVK